MITPWWRQCHCHSLGRITVRKQQNIGPWTSCALCSCLFIFLFVWFLGGAGASASSGKSHSGILWECKDSEKWQLIPLCELLLFSFKSIPLAYCSGEIPFLGIYLLVSEACFLGCTNSGSTMFSALCWAHCRCVLAGSGQNLSLYPVSNLNHPWIAGSVHSITNITVLCSWTGT